VEEALALDGVVAVLTGDDTVAVGNISRPRPQTGRDGRPVVVPRRPALAGDRVVHIGEPVALVVAESAAAARDAAELVAVEYEALPVVTSAREALAAGAPEIWPEAPGNLALDWATPAEEAAVDVERIIAVAAHVVHVKEVNQRISGAPMEVRGATAVFDAETGRFTLYSPSQSAHVLKAQMCAIMGLDPDRLRVLSGDVGGAFGLKTAAYPEYAALLVAAKKLGRPVHWMSGRSEAFLSDNQARDQVCEATLALDGDGRFLALRVAATTNLGAYVTAAGAGIASENFAKCFPGMYDIPHVFVGVRLAFTNTVPTGPYRGAGRPEANYVMERLIDAAARTIGVDPVELRRRNMTAAAAMPYTSAIGNVYDSGDFAATLAAAVELADMRGFEERRSAAARKGRRRGVGVSCFLEHAGGGDEGAVLAVEDGRLIARLGVHASGQGHAAVFGRLSAERLGIPVESVVIEEGDSDLPIRGRPAVGSRSTTAVGAAVVETAGQLIAKGRGLAAGLFGVDAAAVDYRDGYFLVADTNHRLSLFDLADRLARDGAPGALTTVAQAQSATTYPNGCHIAEVEIDPETGKVTVVGYVAVDDCGVVLDPPSAEAQVVGGVAQGLGQALLEAIVYDKDGQLLTGGFADYAMPRAEDVPDVSSAFCPSRCRTNALGVKGVGEAGTTAAIAAVMNAIADAIPDGRGAEIYMPATAEKVWRACQNA
jgi:carbon-monoxide dehydrogenase large subunit